MITIGQLKAKLDALLTENPGWENMDVEVRSKPLNHKVVEASKRHPTAGADIEYRHRSFVIWIEP